MAKCLYCGQFVRPFRKYHTECQSRHDRAVAMIPGFFSKVMASTISPEQFEALLRAAADACFVTTDELEPLCVDGMRGIIDAMSQERPPTSTDVERVAKFLEAIESRYMRGLDLDEALAKAGIIAELYEGRIPSPVTVVGPMPIEFGTGERVVWIFNQVGVCRPPPEVEEAPPIESDAPASRDYLRPDEISAQAVPPGIRRRVARGDLVVTDRNIYFLRSETSQTRMPLVKVVGFQPYADAVHIVCNPAKRSRTFLFDDAWFAANLINGLLRRVQAREPLPA